MKRENAPALTEGAYRGLLLARPELNSRSGKPASGLTESGRVAEDGQASVLHDQSLPLQLKPEAPPLSVDVEQTLAELRTESARLDAAILSLERPSSPAPKDVWAVFTGRKAKACPRRGSAGGREPAGRVTKNLSVRARNHHSEG